ncbi:CotH kinase family protein [Alicyclobacillus dauci]|uniref:CotH kinase family protein n=1 Tax=Alicyclobacillus dauci TaxID=1475485 RepID=A0ABY6ZBD3_9BACL|nr:CotH kinase family protein [Alicyclobacillus dauci]WAH36269.1 CotH kinase family protein [Alicyclobacillus dauci]WAH39410.1 CotH kinase family protein [Alicyclobacillus dauci]
MTQLTAQLDHYSLFIHPNDVRELRRDIWCDDPVEAKLKMGGVRCDVQVGYRGSHIREMPKKSYRVEFETPGNRLVREIHLNAEYNDPSMIRNRLSLELFRELGVHSPDCEHVFLTVNGSPAGVYLRLESVDEYFLRRRSLPFGSIHYAVNDDANFSLISAIDHAAKSRLDDGYERKCGDERSDEQLRQLIYSINTIPRAEFGVQIRNWIDIDKYLRWLAGVVFTQNFDGFIQNYALYCNPQTGLYEIFPWDFDATFGRDIRGEILDYDYVPIEGYNTLSARILDVSEFRHRYRNLLECLLESVFTPKHLNPKVLHLFECIRPYVLQDPYKRAQVQEFEQEVDTILNFIENRRRYLCDHLEDLL